MLQAKFTIGDKVEFKYLKNNNIGIIENFRLKYGNEIYYSIKDCNNTYFETNENYILRKFENNNSLTEFKFKLLNLLLNKKTIFIVMDVNNSEYNITKEVLKNYNELLITIQKLINE